MLSLFQRKAAEFSSEGDVFEDRITVKVFKDVDYISVGSDVYVNDGMFDFRIIVESYKNWRGTRKFSKSRQCVVASEVWKKKLNSEMEGKI